ncbi:MAG: YwiC-like family protein [Chloroflexota bacterium]
MRPMFRKQIALPQDHGSWVFILSPLLIGLFAGGKFNLSSLALVIAAMAAFLLRQPVTMAVKAYSGRRPRTDLPAARFWIVVYGLVILAALGALIVNGFAFILWLAAPGVPIFLWHLWLVSRREERRQAGVEILATGVLALTAPAALWVGLGRYDPTGWWLWLLAWLQSAGSIVYAYLRLEQRDLAEAPARSERWKMGRRALLYASFNLYVSFFLSWLGWIPGLTFVPFALQWFETIWGINNPAIGWKPTRIGIRQLIVSSIWTVLFIVFWRP